MYTVESMRYNFNYEIDKWRDFQMESTFFQIIKGWEAKTFNNPKITFF